MIAKNCPLCRKPLHPKWPDISFDFCIECGLKVRTNVSTVSLENLYKESWIDPNKNLSETGGTDNFLSRFYIRKLIKELKNYEFTDKRLLDFGAGRGDILQALKEQGSNPIGIEPFGHTLLQKRGFSVFPKLSDVNHLSAFDGAFCIDVVEHLLEPIMELREIVSLLKPGGWLFISTPNSFSLRAIIHGQKWEEANRKGHLFLFTPKSLEKALHEAGFTRINRINWYVPYHQIIYRKISNLLLTFLQLDGELRYLAYKERILEIDGNNS